VYVETDGLIDALESDDAPASGKDIKGYLAEFAKAQSALGRLPTGHEVAQVCLFLASASASAITGQCLNVDCGVSPS
jgi:NAD(P)-dependent dehydrogenase (short-subunit alcohol dehydrogenase family)